MAGISIHCVDVTRAIPAVGMRVVVRRADAGDAIFDGRLGEKGVAEPIGHLDPGIYEVTFHVAAWYRDRGVTLTDPPFLDVAPFHFGISAREDHYHLPFKFTPWGFSLFRGS